MGKEALPQPNNLTSLQSELAILDVLFQENRHAELENRARLLLEQHTNAGIVWKLLGLSLHMQGKEALPALQTAATLLPQDAEAQINLAGALHLKGQQEEAVVCCHRALQARPDFAEAHNNLGVILKELGQREEAALSCRNAIKLKPNFAEAHNNLGGALKDMGRLEEAASSYRRAIKTKPGFIEAHYNLGNTLKDLGQMEAAIASYHQALALKPNYAEAYSNLGNALNELHQLDDALKNFRRALEINPELVEAHNNLGTTLLELGHLAEATASYRRAVDIKPDYAEAHCYLGNALASLGELNEAMASYRRAVEINPGYAEAHSNLLFTLNYMADYTPAAYLAEARLYGLMVTQKATAPFSTWSCVKQPARLRVGIVSGDFREHAVGYFLENVLAHIDPARIELIAYSTQLKEDGLTARIKPYFAAWKSLMGLSDQAAAQLIHADGVHVLADVSGHTAHNRLPVFAWKPAPVQFSWIGLPTTTGLAEMDYVLGDPLAIPVEDEGHFAERVWRLPESYLCFTPPAEAPPVAPLPALTSGGVTFGSFNNLAKMSDATVAVWAQVLHAVPHSRLFLKTKQLQDGTVLERTQQRFAAHGIGLERLVLEGDSTPQRGDHLARYHQVDIALDPFPYPGVTTSMEAMWMGVPVITMAGGRFISRTAHSIAHNAGLPDWVASDEAGYVALAVLFSGDLPRLAAVRAGLRAQVQRSPLVDAPRFARNLEGALWGMWGKQ